MSISGSRIIFDPDYKFGTFSNKSIEKDDEAEKCVEEHTRNG